MYFSAQDPFFFVITMYAQVQPQLLFCFLGPTLLAWADVRCHSLGLMPVSWNLQLPQHTKQAEKQTLAQSTVQVAYAVDHPRSQAIPNVLGKAGHRSKFLNAAMFIALAWWFTKYRMCPIILCIFPIIFHKLQLHKYRNTFVLACPLKLVLGKAIRLQQ